MNSHVGANIGAIAHETIDEETPLLLNSKVHKKNERTPLPKLQISLVLLFQLCEPLTSESIYPYINQLVSELDVTRGDPKKVGYYAGLIDSLFFATEAVTVLQWSRASDYIGRRPILLIGSGALSVSMFCFGFSRTFGALVISRCLTGLLNGNIGVMKSAMGDLTDSTNRAEGFAFLPAIWAFGATFGPLIGGSLARPHERFPGVFGGSFWTTYPYLLPCIIISVIVFVIFLINLFLFEETLPKPERPKLRIWERGNLSRRRSSVSHPIYQHDASPSIRNTPVPLRQLLTPRVILSISSYINLAILDIAYGALFPLFCAMPIHLGGLDFPPSTIGYIMGIYGCINGVFQILFFAKIIRRIGEGRVFFIGMATFVPLFGLLPLINHLARVSASPALFWSLIGLLLLLQCVMDLAFGSIYMFVTASSPNKESLGATNGLSQTAVSVARAIGPTLATSLFSLSVEGKYMGEYGVYCVFVALSVASLLLAARLPRTAWDDTDQ